MYEYIKGKLIEKDPTHAVIEANGIAYRVLIPLSTYSALPIQETNLLLYTSFQVKEDSQALYGFSQKHERDLFETLITISGIGPKTGLALIGHLDFSTLQLAVANSNTNLLSKVPGIGKKTAERLVIEMRDKFKKIAKDPSLLTPASTLVSDAVNALIHLGYNAVQAQKAVQKVFDEKKEKVDLSSLISNALQRI
jgi:holliday junction DNA helicase RuvA